MKDLGWITIGIAVAAAVLAFRSGYVADATAMRLGARLDALQEKISEVEGKLQEVENRD